MEDIRVSVKLHQFRRKLIDTKTIGIKLMDDFDKEFADLIQEVVEYVEYHELLVKGVNTLMEMTKQLMNGNVDNPIKFGAEMQRIRTYILDAMYERKGRASMMLAGADE